MADIYEPAPDHRAVRQPQSKDKPLLTTLLTVIVGLAAMGIGLIIGGLGNFAPNFSLAISAMLIGSGNALLGLVDVYVGYQIWNWNTSVKHYGVIANIGLIALNIIFFIIGILGFALILIDILALLLLESGN